MIIVSNNEFAKKACNALANRGLLNWLDDKRYLQLMFWAKMGTKLNLDDPETFNEKLQWLKLYDRKPEYTRMVDKYEAKKYAASIIGEKYIIPTYGVWGHFDEIDFNELPEQFVLKCTHDSGGLAICRDKSLFDKKAAREKLETALKTNYYLHGREWPYKNVKPRIIAEQYMEDESGELRDYKFFCFNGKVKCMKVDFNRYKSHRANYFDVDGNLLKIGEKVCPPNYEKAIRIPACFEQMCQLSELLATDITFLRTDFYNINGNIYFGELTFYPASGFGEFVFEYNDKMLGKWLKLPKQ